MFNLAQQIVKVLALVMLIIALWFVWANESWMTFWGSNPILYAGIMCTGIAVFGYIALRILQWKANTWDALLEGACLAGVFSAILIWRNGDGVNWLVVMFCAIAVGVVAGYLRFFDPRRDN